ncbi:MAG: hypothetical protein WBF77_13605 [Sulfurimonadaceae bacterium]
MQLKSLRHVKTSYLLLAMMIAVTSLLAETKQDDSLATADLAEIDRRLNNPLTNIWSLTFQNNTSAKRGDIIDGTEYTNYLFFQPFLPFEVGAKRQFMLTFRPVFPIVTQPVFDPSDPRNSTGHTTGFGDIQLLTLVGPNRGRGVVWGVGATFKFPTASEDILGEGKYQAGPAAMLFNIGKPWVVGVLAQHWNSFAGDENRADTEQTDIQYIIRRSIPGAMSIGMGPTVTVNWDAEPQNRLTFPVGLGITKTTRWSSTPIKLRAEVHYSVIKPEDFGTAWNFRLQITPVINSPLK